MKAFKIAFIAVSCVMSAACSNHWREANAGLSASDMQTVLDEVTQASASGLGVGNLNEVLALKDDPNASIYFADAFADPAVASPMGRIPNVLGFNDYSFLGFGADFGYRNIDKARVIFIDAPQQDGTRKTALIIGVATNGQDFTYFSFGVGSGTLDGDYYEADVTGGPNNVTLILQSFDASDEGLDSVIQLRIYDAQGNYIGKIATLVGFSS